MNTPLNVPAGGALDFLSLGALIHRLDPGPVPFRKATSCAIHVSGGEFNTAANLADCFGMRTGIASAMVAYPIGELIATRVRAMGVVPFYKMFQHDGAWGPNMATVYSDRGHGVRAPIVFYNRSNEAAAQLKPGDFDWNAIFGSGVRWFHSGGIFASLSETAAELIIEGMKAAKAHGAVVSFDLNYREKLWGASGGVEARGRGPGSDRRACRRPRRQRGGSAEGPGHPRPGGHGEVGARSDHVHRHDRARRRALPADEGGGDDAARGALDQSPQLGGGRVDQRQARTWHRRARSTFTTAWAAATGLRRD